MTEMQNHKLWKLGEDAADEPIEVSDIDPSKATLIYFSGTGDFVDTKPNFFLRRSLLDIVSYDNVDTNKYNFYTVSSRNPRNEYDLLESIDTYNKNPKSYDTEGKELYDLIIKPRIPDLTTSTDEQAQVKENKLFLSTINFIGHSYGAVFMGQIRNSMRKDMEEKGYDKKTIESCMECLLGCYIGPSRKLQKSNRDIPSLYAISDYDPYPKFRGNYKEFVKDDDHEMFRHKLVGNALVVHSHNPPIMMPSISLKKINAPEFERPKENLAGGVDTKALTKLEEHYTKEHKAKKNEPVFSKLKYRLKTRNGEVVSAELVKEPTWKIGLRTRSASEKSEAHHPFRYTNTTKPRKDLTTFIFQTEPFATLVLDFIEKQLSSSIESLEANVPRSGLKIIKNIDKNVLTKEYKDEETQKVRDAQKLSSELFYDFKGPKGFER